MFSISLVFGGIENICYGMNFRSDLLADISRHVQIEWPASDGTFIVKHGNRDVVVRMADNRVDHIGYRIFPEGFREGNVDPKVADFVERYWLSLTLPLERQRTLGQLLIEDRFQFLNGGISSVDILQNNPELPFSCKIEPSFIEMTWGNADRPVCKISFPVNHELILGRRMLENDRRLPEEIKAVVIDESPGRRPGELAADSVPAIRVENAGTYLDVALKSERYYITGTDSVNQDVPVFDPELCVESILNLFTGYDIDKARNIGLNINHKIFGFKQQTIETTIPQFVAYSIKNKCQPYVGIISIDEDKAGAADVLVIMHNRQLGYNHVLRVLLPLECISTGEGVATARLNAFVPSSNIKNLFKD